MKTIMLAAFAVGILVPGVGSADELKPIQVEGQHATLGQWVRQVSHDLDRKLEYPRPAFREDYASGLVAVSFRSDGMGGATNVVVSRSSGNPRLDRAAARAVRTLDTLKPMPGQFSDGQQFRADIIFAADEVNFRRQVAVLQRENKVRMARGPAAANEVAIATSLRVPG